MASRKELESKLTLKQRKAAYLLVADELKPEGERLGQQGIADEVGISRMQLYNWRTKNRAFIEYKNMIADDFLSEMRPVVYRQLMRLITGSQPSVKAIDLYMRRFALLTDKQEVVDNTAEEARSNEKLEKELEELDSLLEEEVEGLDEEDESEEE